METITEAGRKDAPTPRPGLSDPQDPTAALTAPFEARLREHEGRFTLFIPELGILARGKTLEATHAELLRLREARIREFASEGLLGVLPAQGAATADDDAKKGLFGQLKVFLIKAGVVAVLFLGAVNVIGNSLRDVGYTLEKKLEGASNMSAEEVEKNRVKAARVAEKLGPIVRELGVMFSPPDRTAAPGAPPVTPSADSSAANGTARP